VTEAATAVTGEEEGSRHRTISVRDALRCYERVMSCSIDWGMRHRL
jgi:hypothetical protein